MDFPTPPPIRYPEPRGFSEMGVSPTNRTCRIVGADGLAYMVDGDEAGKGIAIIARFSFAMSDASDAEGPKIRLLDGEINGEFPEGMGTSDTGDTYVLGAVAGDVWAGFTYDTSTFELTSRWLDAGSEIPDNEFGTGYVRIGKVWFDDSTEPPTLHYINTHCGDIHVSLRFVTLNAVLHIEAFCTFGDPVEVPDE